MCVCVGGGGGGESTAKNGGQEDEMRASGIRHSVDGHRLEAPPARVNLIVREFCNKQNAADHVTRPMGNTHQPMLNTKGSRVLRVFGYHR